jgi:hypothetical protein
MLLSSVASGELLQVQEKRTSIIYIKSDHGRILSSYSFTLILLRVAFDYHGAVAYYPEFARRNLFNRLEFDCTSLIPNTY